MERAGEQLAVHFTPYDRRDMAGVIDEGGRRIERGAFELSCTRGRAMSVRDAALVAVDALKLAMQANATAAPVEGVPA